MTIQAAAVFGVDPGLGAAVARRFAREVHAVALIASGEAAAREVLTGRTEGMQGSQGWAFRQGSEVPTSGHHASRR